MRNGHTGVHQWRVGRSGGVVECIVERSGIIVRQSLEGRFEGGGVGVENVRVEEKDVELIPTEAVPPRDGGATGGVQTPNAGIISTREDRRR